MHNHKNLLRYVFVTILATAIICGSGIGNCQSVFAQEKPNDKTESITGVVYQFGEKGSYDLSSADKSSSTQSGTESDGQFSITGDISSVSEKNGFPSYSVRGGTLSFSYTYDDGLLKASEDEDHLVDDNSKKVNGQTLDSDIKKGALIVQTSKDGKIWFNVPGATFTNVFKANPDGIREFYTTTDVQMVNGCYYRVLVAYKTAVRTQKAQKFPPKLEKYEYKKYAEAYCFYAYDETAINIAIPESKNRRNLGSKVRTKSEGYVGSTTMDNDDPHFGWDIGRFFVGGFTDYETDTEGNPIFLKNNGDRLSLWFELQQDIDKCYGNSAIRVIADTQGSDADFEVPGGVNQTTDFGRGALIIRKINPDNTKEKPQIFTNYLEASASTDAVTKVDLFEEGDYEVALDYAVNFDKTKIFGKSILPEIAKYKIPFRFSVRNGNSMIFLFDTSTGSELSSGAITKNGFRLDFANSQYLKVSVKREILKDGFDGLTEDTRFNSVATDGDVFTDEGVYTITVTNQYLENADPTVKKVYVGNDNVLKAYMVNNIPIAEIKEMLALGATIAEDGTIIEPEPEPEPTETGTEPAGTSPEPVQTSMTDKTEAVTEVEKRETDAGSATGEETVELHSPEEKVADNSVQVNTEPETEQVEDASEEQVQKKAGLPIIPIIILAVAATVGGFLVKSRKQDTSGRNKENKTE